MKNILKLAILLMVFGSLAACGDDYLDVNTDPNNPAIVTPAHILPTAQWYTAVVEQSDRRLNMLGNLMMANWSQSDGFSWYTDEFKYLVNSTFYTGIFNNTYNFALRQYVDMANYGDSTDYYQGISKIMMAFHYQILVDCYGDIPYSEAIQRKLDPTPKYDEAEKIYDDLILQLTAAIEQINSATGKQQEPAEDDAMFGGDMEKWIQFANTVKLRILTRQSDMASKQTYIADQLAIIDAEGSGYITEDVGINPGYLAGETDKMNIMWESLGWDSEGSVTMNYKATCASEYIIEYLTNTLDPRINKIYEKPGTGHLGVPQGMLDYDTPVVDAYIPENVSNIGPGIMKSSTMSSIIFTLAESYFNQAELADKGLIATADGGKELYENGIEASFLYLGLTTEDAELYFAQPIKNVSWDSSTPKLEAIITQKWIAGNGITAEQSWFDYSRTGYPAGVPLALYYTGSNDRPVRLLYPAGEYSSNGENVPEQTDADAYVKIFWAAE